jgi:hypothetical protein
MQHRLPESVKVQEAVPLQSLPLHARNGAQMGTGLATAA